MRPPRGAIALLALCSTCAAVRGEEAPVEVRLDPPSITVGDRVEVTVELAPAPSDTAGSARLEVPHSRWGRAEVLEPPPPEATLAADGTRVWSFVVTAFEPGRLELPPLELQLGDDPARTIRTRGPVALDVRSVLDSDDLSPAPPAPPRPLPIPAAFGWTSAALAVALLAAALALARRRSAVAAPDAPHPLAELEAALAGLEDRAGDAAFARLSIATRRYLGRRCGFPGPESTTAEVGRRLVAAGVEARAARALRDLLADCDGVKFARRPAPSERLRAARAVALELARGIEAARTAPAGEAR